MCVVVLALLVSVPFFLSESIICIELMVGYSCGLPLFMVCYQGYGR